MVAAGVKIKDDTRWTDSKRMIASVMADPEFKLVPRLQPGTATFNTARKVVGAGDFRRTAEILDEFVDKYPDYPRLPEAYYLLGESFYNTGQTESAVKSIDMLVTHFPETEFAGYGLVRLGRIFEKQERPEEAAEMYDVVIDNYPKSNAAVIAEKSKKDLNL
jgi:tol-pal system protein YbgF